MAKPIRAGAFDADEGRPVPVTEVLSPEIDAASAALRELLELIRLLDDRGFLRFATDLLRSEDRVVEVLAERVPAEELRRAAHNLWVVLRTFREVDPLTLGALARGIPTAFDEARKAETEGPIGLLDVLSSLRDPEVNRGVRMLLGFLRGFGRTAGT